VAPCSISTDFADYFFHTHVAEHFAERGFDFYALDLRRYGRSLRPGNIPFFTTDLQEYYEELDLAVEEIRADGHDRLVVLAHSTGGLVASLWLHDRRPAGIEALVLDSPWLDLQETWFACTVSTWLIRAIGRIRPYVEIPVGVKPAYGESLHVDYHGEWAFNTAWKPVRGSTVRIGWLRAIRRGHARLHKGLDLRMPVLVMHSDKSRLALEEWSPEAMTADTVLEVGHISRWSTSIGWHVTTVAIEDGMHDLFLSPEPVRNRVFIVMDEWLGNVVGDRMPDRVSSV
jgi:alpha-beta hydrolase superfamily lysophospholipase